MRKVEYLRALDDKTWDTIIVEVPSIEEAPSDGVDYDNLSESDIEVELKNYADTVLARLEVHRKVCLFAVYNNKIG
jgi:hypothetical protein